MNTRKQAIEAAARTMAAQNMAGGASPWDAEDDEPGFAHTYGWASPSEFRSGHREMAAEVLAVALPVLLNDLADRIEARRDDYAWHSPELAICAAQHNIAIEFAVQTVRAAAEGWGQ